MNNSRWPSANHTANLRICRYCNLWSTTSDWCKSWQHQILVTGQANRDMTKGLCQGSTPQYRCSGRDERTDRTHTFQNTYLKPTSRPFSIQSPQHPIGQGARLRCAAELPRPESAAPEAARRLMGRPRLNRRNTNISKWVGTTRKEQP